MTIEHDIDEGAAEWERREAKRVPKDYVPEPALLARVDEPSNYWAGFMAGLITGAISASLIWFVVRMITL